MALRKAHQMKFDLINDTAEILINSGLERAQILKSLDSKIKDFEEDSGYKLKLKDFSSLENDGVKFELINTKSDFMRVRNSGPTGKVLRTKIFGVPLTITIHKEGDFSFTNDEMVEALEELASRIKSVKPEIKDLNETDLHKDETLFEDEYPQTIADLEARIEDAEDAEDQKGPDAHESELNEENDDL